MLNIKVFRNTPRSLVYLFSVYLAGLVTFTIFRIGLFCTELRRLEALPTERVGLILQAFFMGFRFDTVVSGYLLLLPTVCFLVIEFLSVEKKIVITTVHWLVASLYCLAFFICAVDIPYFNYFFARLTTAVFQWIDSPVFIFKMIVEEVRYWFYIVPFLLVCTGFIILLQQIRKRTLDRKSDAGSNRGIKRALRTGFYYSIALLALFVGVRGRIAQKSPIRVGTAYFSNYAFPNQLGLNPLFTFIRSYLDDRNPENRSIRIMDPDKAVGLARKYLHVPDSVRFDSPIARDIRPEGEPLPANVVIVMLESMSAAKMGRFGNPNNLTPVLDSLAKISYSFDDVYSAGIHTYNGVYATLFSYPALYKHHPFKDVTIRAYDGIAATLKRSGYTTIYFTTHDDQFDNIAGFLSANEFDEVVSQKDYPSDKILSTLGVADDYLYEYVVKKLSALAASHRPFCAALLTASDHGPYIIPQGIPFKPHSGEIQQQIVEYVDWSIGKFLRLAEKENWFRNTFFVFVADHGSSYSSSYDMPLSYHHTPLIIHAPHMLPSARTVASVGGQIDIFPTLMGLLRIRYVNNTLGVDLLSTQRPFIYFCADDKVGCLNDQYFLVMRTNGLESLYHYRDSDTKNYIERYPALADSMKEYAFCMMQTAQRLISTGKVGEQKKRN